MRGVWYCKSNCWHRSLRDVLGARMWKATRWHDRKRDIGLQCWCDETRAAKFGRRIPIYVPRDGCDTIRWQCQVQMTAPMSTIIHACGVGMQPCIMFCS